MITKRAALAKILVDTCVWSKVLRSNHPDPALTESLKDMISNHSVALIGPILQEILSGVSSKKAYSILKNRLAPFELLPILPDIYLMAAEYFNICKTQGANGSHTDFLICAVCVYYDCPLFTIDNDFKMFKKHLPLKLHSL